MLLKLGVATLVEVSYVLVTRVWLARHFNAIERELYITVLRAITVPIYWALFRNVIGCRRNRVATTKHPLFALGLISLLLAPVLVVNWAPPNLWTRLVFALTSVVVAVREEIFYRGVVQNLLELRLGWVWAIVLSNVIFTAYHYGAWPITFFRLLAVFLVGSVLGLMYYRSGSLRLVIAIHFLYDALASAALLQSRSAAPIWGAGLQLAALGLIVLWVWRAGLGDHTSPSALPA